MLIKTVLARSRAALALAQAKCAAIVHAGPQEPAGGLDIAQLEDRVLFSASPGAEALLAGGVDGADDALDNALELLEEQMTDGLSRATEADEARLGLEKEDAPELRHELVFVDVQSPDYQQLVEDLGERAQDGRQLEVVLLDSGADGIQQVSEALADYHDLDAVHFVSHGAEGAFKLGNTWLRADNVDLYASAIAGWSDALTGHADLLLYGCNVASAADGSALIDSLSAVTGADVAASTDATGNALQGGDWDLEFHAGKIETPLAFSAEVQATWQGVLAADTYYLDGVGDGSDVPKAALKLTAPTDPPLDNYDPGRDAFDGLMIQKSNLGVSETDSAKHQLWHTVPVNSTINERVTLTLWTAMKDFDNSKGGNLTAFLVESNSSGNGLTEIASATISRGDWDTANSGTWIKETFDFGNVNFTLGPSKHLGVKIVVNNSSGDDMWFAYDATTYPARLTVGDNAPDPLWLSTDGNVSGGGQPGVDTWQQGDLIGMGEPNLAFEPGTTNGTFSVPFDIDLFALGANTNAVHFVTSDIQVGASSFQLLAGDLLLSTKANETFTSASTPTATGFTNNLSVIKSDVIVFRPDTPGDYSAGTFAMLLEDPTGAGPEIRGISLIERNTSVGDTILQAGDFLYTRSGGGEDQDIWLFQTIDVGAGNTSGTTSALLEGTDVNVSISKQIHGLDLVETTMTIGGRTLDAGTILLSVDANDDVGSNNLPVTPYDVFALNVTQTTLISGAGNGAATASLLFQGADVAFDSGAEKIDGVTLTAANNSNSAPVLDNLGNMVLTDINEDDTAPTGDTVANIIASAGGNRITDVDAGALEGIAVIGVDDTNGQWQYSTTSGATWLAFGAVSDTSAVLLDTTALIRFVPNANYNGSAGNIRFRAWDQSSGANGETGVDVSTNGGTTAYSSASETASLNVNPLNDAPVLDNTGTMTLTDVTEDDTNPAGETVSAIITSAGGDRITDPDSAAVEGLAVIGVDNTNGQWQYSTTSGATWLAFGAVSDTSAVLLDTTALIRFVPNANYNGAAGVITFRGWDQTSGANGDTAVDVSTHGGTTAFSSVTETATLTVNPVNDPPTITNLASDMLTYTAGDGAVVIEQGADALASDIDSLDFNTGNLTVSIMSGGDAAQDVLSVRHQGMGAGQIGRSGGSIFYGGTLIGMATGGSGGADLVVTLNANATPAAVTALVKNVTYENTNTVNPSTTPRTVRFAVQDGDGGTSSPYDAFVFITDPLNTPPTDIAPSTFVVDENTNTTGGYSLGILSTTDPDASDTFIYTIVGGADAAKFSIGGVGSGQLLLDDGTLNYEAKSSYAVMVRTTDSAGNWYEETITVAVNNLNEPVGPINDTDASVNSVAENAGVGTAVGITALATDPDVSDTVTYSLDNDAGGRFAISSSTGVMTLVGGLDAETSTNHNVLVRATSSDGSFATRAFTISVSDVNETPTAITPTTFAVNENTDTAGGYSLGNLSTTDPDSPESFTYSIVGGPDAVKFSIGGAGLDELLLDDGLLDFESQNSYSVVVRVTDSGGLAFQDTLAISVVDANDTAPVITLGQSFSVSEDAANGTLIGAVVATDADTIGSLQNWTIASGNDGGIFQIDPGTGQISVADNSNLNYSSTTDYTLAIKVCDGVNWSAIQNVTIAVIDVNYSPVAVNDNYAVDAGGQLQVPAGGVLANDTDRDGDPLTALRIDGPAHGTLDFRADGSFVYTPAAGFFGQDQFTYKAKDVGASSQVATATITVNPPVPPPPPPPIVVVNDPPPNDPPPAVEENVPQSSDGSSAEPVGLGAVPPRADAMRPLGRGDLENLSLPELANLAGVAAGNAAEDFDLTGADGNAESYFALMFRAWRTLPESRWGSASDGTSMMEMSLAPPIDIAYFSELESVAEMMTSEIELDGLSAGALGMMSLSLSAGYAFFTIRAGYLVSSLLATMPAWRMIDPLPVLTYLDANRQKRGDSQEAETLQSLLRRDGQPSGSDDPHAEAGANRAKRGRQR